MHIAAKVKVLIVHLRLEFVCGIVYFWISHTSRYGVVNPGESWSMSLNV